MQVRGRQRDIHSRAESLSAQDAHLEKGESWGLSQEFYGVTEINCQNIKSGFDPADETSFWIQHKDSRFGFVFSKATDCLKVMNHLDRYWIRGDFYDRYDIQEQIGKGGFATVSRAVRVKDRRLFAAKMIRKDKIAKDKERSYFINELRVSRQVDHPLLVRTYEVHEVDSCFIIIQDFIEGVNLLQYIKLKKRLNETISLHVTHQLLTSILYLHKLRIIHRDIKPQNIMLKLTKDEKNIDFREKYEIILIDFGLCADADDHSTTSFLHDKSGTTGYLAPEVIKNSKPFYDEKVDIFSVGVVLVEMLSGKNPFKSSDNKQMLINNYICAINFAEIEMRKSSLTFAAKLLEKNVAFRPSAKEALEDDIFCIADSHVNVDTDFLEEKHIGGERETLEQ